MSLMRLLVAGASLKGIRDRRSPYKMTQQNLLPKFGSARQGEAGVADVGSVAQVSKPAVSRVSELADPSTDRVPSKVPHPADLEVGDTAGLETCATALSKAPRVGGESGGTARPAAQHEGMQMNAAQMVSKDAAPLVAEGGQVAGLPAQRQPGVVAHYGTVFWSWVKVRNPFRHKVARGDARGAVQPELLLDAVQVVRNDLSEADLEIIPAAKTPKTSIQSVAATDPQRAKLVWQRISGRLFGPRRP